MQTNPFDPDVPEEGLSALPSVLDLEASAPLRLSMQRLLLSGQPIILDASLVGRVSTPCIQILLAAMAGAQLRGLPFKLREPSSMLAEALADLGLASHFGL